MDELGEEGATARSKADAPEIDGQVFVDTEGEPSFATGDIIRVSVTDSDDYDLWARPV